jgi:mono/diheme cytochrome c family protein
LTWINETRFLEWNSSVRKAFGHYANERSMNTRTTIGLLTLAAAGAFVLCSPTASFADSVQNGRRIALRACAHCHTVVTGPPGAVTQAPSFSAIAAKYGANADMIAWAIRSPHPRMNFTPTAPEIRDLAAYIASLGR